MMEFLAANFNLPTIIVSIFVFGGTGWLLYHEHKTGGLGCCDGSCGGGGCGMGEGGRQLSGGELRRLAIARALLHDAPLMLLDEPTEGLDATTESQILDLLAEVMREKTVLMVTHRLRGLARFNRIIVMDNGKIIEQGSHAELLAEQGRYYQFKQRL